MTYTFTINGNHENIFANPVPYFRTTQGSKFSDGALRYAKWKSYVQKCFEIQNDLKPVLGKPITLTKTQTAEMHIFIGWADNTHGDCDNVYKGIADALFKNDKQLTKGSFDSIKSKGKGYVKVTITIHEHT